MTIDLVLVVWEVLKLGGILGSNPFGQSADFNIEIRLLPVAGYFTRQRGVAVGGFHVGGSGRHEFGRRFDAEGGMHLFSQFEERDRTLRADIHHPTPALGKKSAGGEDGRHVVHTGEGSAAGPVSEYADGAALSEEMEPDADDVAIGVIQPLAHAIDVVGAPDDRIEAELTAVRETAERGGTIQFVLLILLGGVAGAWALSWISRRKEAAAGSPLVTVPPAPTPVPTRRARPMPSAFDDLLDSRDDILPPGGQR